MSSINNLVRSEIRTVQESLEQATIIVNSIDRAELLGLDDVADSGTEQQLINAANQALQAAKSLSILYGILKAR